MQRTMRVLLVVVATVVGACQADRAISPDGPPLGVVSFAPVVGTYGACEWGGDDFQADAVWDTLPCASVSAFTGQSFTATLDEGSHDYWIDPSEYVPVYWLRAASWVDQSQTITALGSPSYSSLPPFSGLQLAANLSSSVDAVFWIGYVGGCPINTYVDDAQCRTWAITNGIYHNEPMFCVTNPAWQGMITPCNTIIDNGFAID